MEKKVILLTGASGGLGKQLTKWFLEKDYNLILQYHSGKIELESENVLCVKCDLSDAVQLDNLIHLGIQKFGKIDVLINNAGISKSAISWKMDLATWRETMAINLDAPFLLSQGVIPGMRQANYGKIINISSVVAQTGAIGTAAYTASKAGLIGLTKTLAKELATNNITVNALALGYFDTGMIRDVPESRREEIIETIPMRKLGDPKTVFAAIEWILADESNYITGQVIHLNGGIYV
jgi:NAD(P)-dependent dehydrogenase (short-subunit alcohol dehydrogenase family)